MDSDSKFIISNDSIKNKSDYKRVEFSLGGKRAYALFPINTPDVKTMVMIKEMLIKSYLSDCFNEK